MKVSPLLVPTLLAMPVLSCGVEDGTQIEILHAVLPNPQCEFLGNPEQYSPRGFWDPSGTTHYVMTVELRSNLAANDVNFEDAPGQISTNQNAVALRGFDTCWFRGNDPAVGFTDFDSTQTPVADCEELPTTQRRFVPSTGSLDPDSTLSAFVDAPDREMLEALYGTAFEPGLIPFSDDPTDAMTRDATWGNFPNEFSELVGIQVRAVGETQDGSTIRSNWFTYPIDVCPLCVRDTNPCSNPPSLKACTNPCGAALPMLGAPACTGGVCSNLAGHPVSGLACTALALQGNIPNFRASCFPFQRFFDPVCVAENQCLQY